ncbi:MAG: carboxyl-terminal processing protease CtpA [Cyanobacteriota bacterium]|jgi:carboxyl-terminal processing protease
MPYPKVWVSLFLGLLLWLGSWGAPPTALAFSDEQKLVLQSWRLVNQSYLDETFNHQNWWNLRQKYLRRSLRSEEEAYQAIEEMLATLDEPFTRLLRPEQYRSLQVSTSGELSGVGLQINLNPDTGNLEVIAPLAGSPAEAAGILPRSRILEIDGAETENLSLDEAAARMRGPQGTQVSLTVLPPGEAQSPQTLVLTRNRIALSPVLARLDKSSTQTPVGYIRLTQFSANAPQEMAKAIRQLSREGAQAFVLDLRNNPGGLLQAGVDIARLWLPEGTIVYTVNRQGIQESFTALDSALTDAPLAVLVNPGTASASEILAGALQDNGRALLIGEKTFGKGLIQSLFELQDGAGLAVTVAKYETPSHRDIHKQGIQPDLAVPQTGLTFAEMGSSEDLQYQAALNQLSVNNYQLSDASKRGDV